MMKSKFERQIPQHKLEKNINNGAQKIKRLIIQCGLRIDPIRDKLNAEALNRKVNSSIILKRGLEILYEEGSFSEKLEKEYIDLIAEEVADIAASGKQLFSQAIGEKITELERKKIYINQEQLRRAVEQKIE